MSTILANFSVEPDDVEVLLDFWLEEEEGVEGLWSHTDRLIVHPGTFEKRSLRYSTFFVPKSQTPSWAPVTIWTPDRSPMQVSVYSMGAVLTWEKFFHLIGSNHRLSCSSGPCHLGGPIATWASQCGWRIFGRDIRCCRWISSLFCLEASRLSLRPVTGLRPTVTCNFVTQFWVISATC